MNGVTVTESGGYFYIMFGDSDAECYVQRKFQEGGADDPIDHKLPESIIIGLCERVLKLEKER